MRKEVVLATKAELADRHHSREEPLSKFNLEKLKAWSMGWTPDRGKGTPACLAFTLESERNPVRLLVLDANPEELEAWRKGWTPDHGVGAPACQEGFHSTKGVTLGGLHQSWEQLGDP